MPETEPETKKMHLITEAGFFRTYIYSLVLLSGLIAVVWHTQRIQTQRQFDLAHIQLMMVKLLAIEPPKT